MTAVEKTESHTEENFQDFTTIYNYSLRDYLSRINNELPQDQDKFYSLDLSKYTSALRISYGGQEFNFHPSIISSFVTRLKSRKTVRYNTTTDNKPRNFYTRRRALAAFSLFWASKTLAQERHDSLNWTKLEMVAKQVLQYHPIRKNILPSDPNRTFPDQHHLIKSKSL